MMYCAGWKIDSTGYVNANLIHKYNSFSSILADSTYISREMKASGAPFAWWDIKMSQNCSSCIIFSQSIEKSVHKTPYPYERVIIPY